MYLPQQRIVAPLQDVWYRYCGNIFNPAGQAALRFVADADAPAPVAEANAAADEGDDDPLLAQLDALSMAADGGDVELADAAGP